MHSATYTGRMDAERLLIKIRQGQPCDGLMEHMGSKKLHTAKNYLFGLAARRQPTFKLFAGDPGAGKTTFAALVTRSARSLPHVTVVETSIVSEKGFKQMDFVCDLVFSGPLILNAICTLHTKFINQPDEFDSVFANFRSKPLSFAICAIFAQAIDASDSRAADEAAALTTIALRTWALDGKVTPLKNLSPPSDASRNFFYVKETNYQQILSGMLEFYSSIGVYPLWVVDEIEQIVSMRKGMSGSDAMLATLREVIDSIFYGNNKAALFALSTYDGEQELKRYPALVSRISGPLDFSLTNPRWDMQAFSDWSAASVIEKLLEIYQASQVAGDDEAGNVYSNRGLLDEQVTSYIAEKLSSKDPARYRLRSTIDALDKLSSAEEFLAFKKKILPTPKPKDEYDQVVSNFSASLAAAEPPEKSTRIYLNVSYHDRNFAKTAALNAGVLFKFDQDINCWWCDRHEGDLLRWPLKYETSNESLESTKSNFSGNLTFAQEMDADAFSPRLESLSDVVAIENPLDASIHAFCGASYPYESEDSKPESVPDEIAADKIIDTSCWLNGVSSFDTATQPAAETLAEVQVQVQVQVQVEVEGPVDTLKDKGLAPAVELQLFGEPLFFGQASVFDDCFEEMASNEPTAFNSEVALYKPLFSNNPEDQAKELEDTRVINYAKRFRLSNTFAEIAVLKSAKSSIEASPIVYMARSIASFRDTSQLFGKNIKDSALMELTEAIQRKLRVWRDHPVFLEFFEGQDIEKIIEIFEDEADTVLQGKNLCKKIKTHHPKQKQEKSNKESKFELVNVLVSKIFNKEKENQNDIDEEAKVEKIVFINPFETLGSMRSYFYISCLLAGVFPEDEKADEVVLHVMKKFKPSEPRISKNGIQFVTTNKDWYWSKMHGNCSYYADVAFTS